VRFIGNWSTGTQGYALASAAVARGAEVTVVAANVALPDPAGAKVTRVVSAREMADAVLAAASLRDGADAVVMAAAVADYRPAERSAAKLKKDGQPPEPLRLTENPDILAGLAAARSARHQRRDFDTERVGRVPSASHPQVLVGFAAETDTSPETARAKLARKGCDLLVVNPVGHGLGFGTPDNEAVVYGADGTVTPIPRGPKQALADVVWDLVAARLNDSVSYG
jgi:phosphopantothenoylcysteine decarboxylase/phosphopantothenate--cysteine ligase